MRCLFLDDFSLPLLFSPLRVTRETEFFKLARFSPFFLGNERFPFCRRGLVARASPPFFPLSNPKKRSAEGEREETPFLLGGESAGTVIDPIH